MTWLIAAFAGLSRFGKSATRSLSPAGWALMALLIGMLVILVTCQIKKATTGDRPTRGEVVRDQTAREEAAGSRLEDQRQQDQVKEKLNEAIRDLPDGVPSARRTAIACQRLRNDGHTVLPASCGPAPDRQTPPRPG